MKITHLYALWSVGAILCGLYVLWKKELPIELEGLTRLGTLRGPLLYLLAIALLFLGVLTLLNPELPIRWFQNAVY